MKGSPVSAVAGLSRARLSRAVRSLIVGGVAVAVTAPLAPASASTGAAAPDAGGSPAVVEVVTPRTAYTAGLDARVVVRGRVVADDLPVAGRPVQLLRHKGDRWVVVARTRTAADGTVRQPVTADAAMALRLQVEPAAGSPAARSDVIKVQLTRGARLIAEARRHYGKPYRWGATGPSSFDCSGFTRFVFAREGLSLPRTSRQQYAATTRIAKADKRVGDLIFLHSSSGRVYHVGIYAGGNRMWAATSAGDIIRTQAIRTTRYKVGRVR